MGGAARLEEREEFALLRRKWDVRQGEVAEAAGCSQPTVSGWERGRRPLDGERRGALWAALGRLVEERRRAGEAA